MYAPVGVVVCDETGQCGVCVGGGGEGGLQVDNYV